MVPEIPLATAVGEATANRPDVKQAALDLDARKIVVRGTRNLLLPTLTLSGQYITQGLGGNSIVTAAGPGSFLPTGNPIVDANGVPITTGGLMEFASVPTPGASTLLRGGLHDSLAEVFQSNFPTYGVSLNLSLPLRNRVAQAANINAQLQQKQSAANLQRIRNTVAVDVRNAQIALAQDKAAVDADIRARILAEQTLDAEQKKFLLGASTTFLVIQAERDLANARSTEVRALANLAEAKVNFDRALGRTLAVNRIDVADAAHPDVRVPLIPGTPTSELSSGTRTGDY